MVAPMTPQVEMQEGTELLAGDAPARAEHAEESPNGPPPALVWLGARIPAEIKRKIVDTAETCQVSQQEVITRALGASLGGESTRPQAYPRLEPIAGAQPLLAANTLQLSIPPNACGVRITIEGPTSYGAVLPASPAESAAPEAEAAA